MSCLLSLSTCRSPRHFMFNLHLRSVPHRMFPFPSLSYPQILNCSGRIAQGCLRFLPLLHFVHLISCQSLDETSQISFTFIYLHFHYLHLRPSHCQHAESSLCLLPFKDSARLSIIVATCSLSVFPLVEKLQAGKHYIY